MGAGGSETATCLGLTGPIGCGKTTVGDILLDLGAGTRIDADTVVHELMTAGTPVTAAVAERFGSGVLREDGSVDRGVLAGTVFDHPAELRALEAIVHPPVRARIRDRIATEAGKGIVVLDAVKLLQSDLHELVDAVWVVLCDPDDQIHRLTEFRGMTLAAAQARIRAQPSFDGAGVTRIVPNSGSLSELRREVEAGWIEFLSAGR